MRKFLIGLWQDESGAAGAEYALLLAIVGIGIVTAALALETSISTAMQTAADCINDTATC